MNLNPDQQTNFLDLMRPPVGYRLGAAVGTTYSLDFIALTSLMLAFVDSEMDDDAGDLNQVEVLRAITRLADRVRLFVHRGRINTRPDELKKYGRLSGMYDRIVRGVALPEGSFHPKVWVLHFTPKAKSAAAGNPPLIRVVCSSRNLTTSSTWEAFASFDGSVGDKSGSTKLGSEVAAFLNRLRREFSRDAALLAQLAEASASAVFPARSSESTSPRFHWQWHGGANMWKEFPTTGSHVLVVSPFVSATFLRKLLKGYDQVILISTQDELDALSDDFYSQFRKQDELFIVRPARAEHDTEALQLHAKIYLAESRASRVMMMLGSANASESAWSGNNCEAMVSVTPGLPIARFMNQFVYGPADDAERPLRCWIQHYLRQPVVVNEITRMEKRLDAAQNAVSRLIYWVDYLREEKLLRITCSDFRRALPDLQGVQMRLCPLTRFKHSSDLLPAEPLLDGNVEFSGVRLAEVTEFLLLELTAASARPRYFAVQAESDFDELRSDRDSAVLDECLTPDSFRRFLHAILFDRLPSDAPSVPGGGERTKDFPASHPLGTFPSILGETPLEDIMLACTEDSDRIIEIDQLLATFQRTAMMTAEYQQFLQFWKLFKASCTSARKVML